MSNPLTRAAALVDIIAASGGGLTLNVIAQLTRLPQSTTHRQLQGLLSIGYVQMDGATKTYSLGDRLRRVLDMSLGTASLKELARPVLDELAESVAATAYLVRYEAGSIRLVDFVMPQHGSRTLVHPGFEFPFHATAAGKAILAFASDAEVKVALEKPLPRFLKNTIVKPTLLRQELAKIRKQRYAVNDLELDPGVFALAAPVELGKLGVGAAIGLVGLRQRLAPKASRDKAVAELKDAARQLSDLFIAVRRNGAG